MAITAHPLTAALGAEVRGVDLVDLGDDGFEQLHKLFLDHKVLFFRDQHLSTEEHIAFGRRWGDLEVHPFAPNGGVAPEVVQLLSTAEKPYAAAGWHSDVTWRQEPSMGSILRARELPPVGGDTCWANTEMAYQRLPDDLKERIDDLVCVHDYLRVFGRRIKPEKREEMRETYPPARHPVVRTHPETGAKGIYTNRAFGDHIEGIDEEESDAILLRLEQAIAGDPSVQCRFRWEVDSIAMWDNRCTQHFATNDFWPETRRMERVTVAGDRPY